MWVSEDEQVSTQPCTTRHQTVAATQQQQALLLASVLDVKSRASPSVRRKHCSRSDTCSSFICLHMCMAPYFRIYRRSRVDVCIQADSFAVLIVAHPPCRPQTLPFVAEGRTWSPDMRAVTKPVFASPTETAVNLDSSRAEASNPATCYPQICFAVDNFEDTFDEMVSKSSVLFEFSRKYYMALMTTPQPAAATAQLVAAPPLVQTAAVSKGRTATCMKDFNCSRPMHWISRCYAAMRRVQNCRSFLNRTIRVSKYALFEGVGLPFWADSSAL